MLRLRRLSRRSGRVQVRSSRPAILARPSDPRSRFAHRRSPRRNGIFQEYALPDFTPGFMEGYISRGPNAAPPPARDVEQLPSAADDPRAPPRAVKPLEDDQILPLENERFSVPELLFNPSDIGSPMRLLLPTEPMTDSWWSSGMDQVGLPDAIAESIALLPEDLQGLFWANVGVFGGTSSCEGFLPRL